MKWVQNRGKCSSNVTGDTVFVVLNPNYVFFPIDTYTVHTHTHTQLKTEKKIVQNTCFYLNKASVDILKIQLNSKKKTK